MQQKHSIPVEKPIRVAEIRVKEVFPFEAQTTPSQIEELVSLLGISKLSKLRFRGEFTANKNGDIQLAAEIGATLQQPCSITLAPVTTRIDAKIVRSYSENDAKSEIEAETELLEDDPEDFVPDQFVLFDLLAEGLALEIPEYPKAEGAELTESVFTEPGKKPMTDEDARPFAGLAALKDQLKDDGTGS